MQVISASRCVLNLTDGPRADLESVHPYKHPSEQPTDLTATHDGALSRSTQGEGGRLEALVVRLVMRSSPGDLPIQERAGLLFWADQDCRAAFRLLLVSFVVSSA